MAPEKKLLLHEELMLLALRDRKGTLAADSTAFGYTLAAALISELLLSGHVRLDEVRKNKKMVELARTSRLRDPLLDECVERIGNAGRRGSLQTWVSRLAGIRRLRHRIALQLCRRGILHADEEKVLLIFSRKIYPEVNPKPEREIISRLKKAIFGRTRTVEPRTAVLVALAEKAGVLKNVFDRADLKGAKARIKEIASGNVTAAAAQDVIDSVNAAIMVAVMVPAITAATSATH